MELSPYVNEIIGVEKSSEMIEKANKKSIENIKMIEGNISDLHKILPKKCCDVVICTLVSFCCVVCSLILNFNLEI